jgi:hypothetical protein
MKYQTLRDRKAGALLDARCEADLAIRPFGGLDKVTFAWAEEDLEPHEVRAQLGLPAIVDELSGPATSNLRAALLDLGYTEAAVLDIAAGKVVGKAELDALLAAPDDGKLRPVR